MRDVFVIILVLLSFFVISLFSKSDLSTKSLTQQDKNRAYDIKVSIL